MILPGGEYASEGWDNDQEVITTPNGKLRVPTHLELPSPYHPLATQFATLKGVIEFVVIAARRMITEQRRVYIKRTAIRIIEPDSREMLRDYEA